MMNRSAIKKLLQVIFYVGVLLFVYSFGKSRSDTVYVDKVKTETVKIVFRDTVRIKETYLDTIYKTTLIHDTLYIKADSNNTITVFEYSDIDLSDVFMSLIEYSVVNDSIIRKGITGSINKSLYDHVRIFGNGTVVMTHKTYYAISYMLFSSLYNIGIYLMVEKLSHNNSFYLFGGYSLTGFEKSRSFLVPEFGVGYRRTLWIR